MEELEYLRSIDFSLHVLIIVKLFEIMKGAMLKYNKRGGKLWRL